MCHNANYDLEAYESKLDGHIAKEYVLPTLDDAIVIKPVLLDLVDMESVSQVTLQRLLKKHKATKYRKNSYIIQCMYLLIRQELFDPKHENHIKNLLRIKRGKSHSGIVSVTIFTSPEPSYVDAAGNTKTQMFTCQWNCHYCPNEPGQPRSYLKGEPGVMRANRSKFDPVDQVHQRLTALYTIGHDLHGAKLEILILGGTFTSYPVEYREQFIRDTYYAANTFMQADVSRVKGTLQDEIAINRDANCRIIGLTTEMRPDCITRQELHRLRSYGCTRVQLGVQHIDNGILKGINRRCTTERLVKALELLKNCCFKIDIHLMANLPFASPAIDRRMLVDQFLGLRTPTTSTFDDDSGVTWENWDIAEPGISADQWKLYPCETVPYTEIEKWYREGSYKPYAQDELFQILYDTKRAMYPWIRTNRIIRDIPKGYIIASSNEPNTGQVLLDTLKKNGHHCMCIRCREVKEKESDGNHALVVRHYKASNGDEYFISIESEDKRTLYGFVRLRLATPATDVFPELAGCALIRELHTYSNMSPATGGAGCGTGGCSGAVGGSHASLQHKGIGKTLLATAEKIAKEKGYSNIAVISGVGVQRYYEKLGYYNDSEGKGNFMIKNFMA